MAKVFPYRYSYPNDAVNSKTWRFLEVLAVIYNMIKFDGSGAVAIFLSTSFERQLEEPT